MCWSTYGPTATTKGVSGREQAWEKNGDSETANFKPSSADVQLSERTIQRNPFLHFQLLSITELKRAESFKLPKSLLQTIHSSVIYLTWAKCKAPIAYHILIMLMQTHLYFMQYSKKISKYSLKCKYHHLVKTKLQRIQKSFFIGLI